MNQQPHKLIDKLDVFFGHLAEWSINNRIIVVLSVCLMLLTGGYYMAQVRVDGSIDGFFDKSDTAYLSYKDYLRDFSSDEIVYVLYEVPKAEEGPFNLEAMRTIAELTQAFEDEVPFVREVTSLANVEFMYADDDDSLVVGEVLIDFPKNQAELSAIKQRMMDKPLYVDYLINKEANYAAIFLEMALTSSDPIEKFIYDPEQGEALDNLYPQVSDSKVREILARPEFANAGIEFYLVGDVPMNTLYNHLFMSDTTTIVMYTLCFIIVLSFILFNTSLIGLLSPIVVVLMSIVMMFGFIGWMGWGAGLFITITPALLCAIGVAQSVHVLQEYQRSLAQQGNKSVAVKKAMSKVGGPCLLAAITTAAGFFVMSVSDMKALAELGWYAGVGVMFVFVLSMTLMVVFLAGGDKKGAVVNDNTGDDDVVLDDLKGVNPLVAKIVEASITVSQAYPKIILVVFAIIFMCSAVGISKLKVDFNFLKEFKPHIEWRQHTELADEVMGGVNSVVYLIDTATENGVKNVELLQAIDKLQRYAESLPLVKKSFSITDIVKDLNQSLHNDDKDFYTIPDNQPLVAQYLLVYEVSGGKELADFVTSDFSTTVLELRVMMTNASDMKATMDKIDAYLLANPLPNATAKATGMGLLWIKMADYIAQTQIVSYALMFICIALVMCLAYGSIKLGMLSMIPNVTPVVITLGAMGWLGIDLDYLKLLLATIAIGIATDDTIHLVTRYRSRFYELGNYADALTASLRDVGPALVTTTFILIGGFSAYLITDLQVLADFGVLLAATISIALVADLLLMPALMSTVKPLGKETTQQRLY